jgi:membrane fusion protein (multidrug efflux system)
MPDDQSQPPRGPDVRSPRAAPDPAPGAASAPPTSASRMSALRKPLFALLAVVIVFAALAWGAYYLMIASHYITTDDAYVGADVAAITPQVAGQVAEVKVQDTQAVKAGDVLVVIDPADAKLAVASAQAEYGRAVRRVQQDMANDQAARAAILARDADLDRAKAQLAAAQSDVDRTRIDLQRREALAQSGAVSGEELTTAKNAYQTAQANLAAVKAAGAQAEANKTIAEGQLASAEALTQGADVQTNPEVVAARVMLNTALLNLSRTTIRAPFDGVIARRQVQVGQRVAVGAELMSLVPVSQVYVDANFKEVQLRKMKVCQPATLTADRYGKSVEFHGHVVGLGGGTGSAFALIPAQNATGNWIKVVQRLPVRIALDPKDLAAHPLRVGLSMDAKVDVSAAPDDCGGRP